MRILIFSKRDRLHRASELSSVLQGYIKKSKKFCNNYHKVREINFLCVMKEIVCCIDTTI